MGKDKDNFIFRREHRRLTYTSILAILPLFITALVAGLIYAFDIALARSTLTLILALPTWSLAIFWFALPVLSLYLSRRAEKYGTLYQLRSWNGLTFKLALALLAGEGVVIVLQLL